MIFQQIYFNCKKEKIALGHILGHRSKDLAEKSRITHGVKKKVFLIFGNVKRATEIIQKSFTDRKGESVGVLGTNQNERISTKPERFQQTMQSFNSILKNTHTRHRFYIETTKDTIIGELTCPMEACVTK